MEELDLTKEQRSDRLKGAFLFGGAAVVVLLVHLATNGNLGFHTDELYYIDCGRHQRASLRIGERSAYFAPRCEFVPISGLPDKQGLVTLAEQNVLGSMGSGLQESPRVH